jgi:hypothetical protein
MFEKIYKYKYQINFENILVILSKIDLYQTQKDGGEGGEGKRADDGGSDVGPVGAGRQGAQEPDQRCSGEGRRRRGRGRD